MLRNPLAERLPLVRVAKRKVVRGLRDSDCLRQVLLLGTPAVWWAGVLALIAALFWWIGARDWRFGIAVVGAASTWLPWFLYDGRPIFSRKDLAEMGYAAIIDAQVMLLPAFVAQQRMLRELKATGTFTGLSEAECVAARQAIEDTIGLDAHYEIERETVEKG